MECQDQSLVVISSGTAKPAQRANDECGPLPLQSADDGQLPIFSKSHEGRIWATSSPDVAHSLSSLTKYTGPQRHELSRYSDCVAEHSECDLQPSEIIICCGINFLKDKGVGTSQTRDGRRCLHSAAKRRTTL